jgi:hypothetical protein
MRCETRARRTRRNVRIAGTKTTQTRNGVVTCVRVVDTFLMYPITQQPPQPIFKHRIWIEDGTEQWRHENPTHNKQEHTKHTQTHCKTLKHFKATFQNQFKGRGGGQRPFTQHCWQPRPQSLPVPPSFMFAPHHGPLTEIIDVHPTRRDPGI